MYNEWVVGCPSSFKEATIAWVYFAKRLIDKANSFISSDFENFFPAQEVW